MGVKVSQAPSPPCKCQFHTAVGMDLVQRGPCTMLGWHVQRRLGNEGLTVNNRQTEATRCICPHTLRALSELRDWILQLQPHRSKQKTRGSSKQRVPPLPPANAKVIQLRNQDVSVSQDGCSCYRPCNPPLSREQGAVRGRRLPRWRQRLRSVLSSSRSRSSHPC